MADKLGTAFMYFVLIANIGCCFLPFVTHHWMTFPISIGATLLIFDAIRKNRERIKKLNACRKMFEERYYE